MELELLIIQALNGISWGAILFTVGAGFSLVFGFTDVVNLSHGSLYLLGAFVGLSVIEGTGNFLLGIIVGGITTGIISVLMERGLLRHLHGSVLRQVLLTAGFIYIFAGMIQRIWGTRPRILAVPSILSGTIPLGVLRFPIYRLLIIGAGLLIFISLLLWLRKTRTGSIVRAGMDDEHMVEAMGVNLGIYFAAIFFIGGLLAGSAGVAAGPIVGLYLGLDVEILILALIIAVIGGIGSLEGAFLAAIIIGLIDSFGKAFFPSFAMFTVYFFLILVLMFRPSGFFGMRE